METSGKTELREKKMGSSIYSSRGGGGRTEEKFGERRRGGAIYIALIFNHRNVASCFVELTQRRVGRVVPRSGIFSNLAIYISRLGNHATPHVVCCNSAGYSLCGSVSGDCVWLLLLNHAQENIYQKEAATG